MQELILSNKIFVFVCYEAGSGGENLATRVSKLAGCTPLEYFKTTEDRTMIVNEYFDKVFLRSFWDFDKVVDTAGQILKQKPLNNEINIIPSHWDCTNLLPYFPNGKFIRIVHNNGPELSDNITKKIYGRKFDSFQEFIGFCYVYVDDDALKKLLKDNQISMRMNAGQVVELLKPYMKNTVNLSRLGKYTELIEHDAVLNVWYKTVDESMDKIFNFIRQGEKV